LAGHGPVGSCLCVVCASFARLLFSTQYHEVPNIADMWLHDILGIFNLF
jgi:hypothetical protein